MKYKHTSTLIALLLITPPVVACPKDAFHDQKEGKGSKISRRLDWAQLPDPANGPVLERPKQLTFNGWEPHIPGEGEPTEAADPTRPLKVGDGTYRVDASGKDAFVFKNLEEFMRGGNHDTKRMPITVRWSDGTLTSGPYHTGNHSWDKLTAIWPVENSQGVVVGYKKVGYLGMMEQPYKMAGASGEDLLKKAPQMPLHNYARSRWAADIVEENGKEIWTARTSVFHHQPPAPSHNPIIPIDQRGQWVTPTHNHGYGGRPLMDNEGKVFKFDNTYWMIFEQVMEQKEVHYADGAIGYLPWVTEVVARRMKNPYEAYAAGELMPDGRRAEAFVKLCSVRDKSGEFNPASDRHGLGYLIEGFNLIGVPVPIGGKKYWIGFASPNNYTEKYGVTMWVREESLGPIGEYEPMVDKNGVWRDITESFRKKYGLVGWFGRGDGFFTPEQLNQFKFEHLTGEVPFSMIGHGTNPKSLPKDFPKIGWPTPEQYNYYIRAQWLLFGRFMKGSDGKPDVRWMLPEPPASETAAKEVEKVQ